MHFQKFARHEFEKNIGLNKKDFSAIEYLLRKGNRQLEIYASPVADQASPSILLHTQSQEKILAGPSPGPAGVPFLLPLLREPSICVNASNKLLAGLPAAHIFEHPAPLDSGLKTGDPVKRDLTPKHRRTNPSAASPSPHLLFAVPAPPPPSGLPVIDSAEVTYQDILDGLQLGLSAILDSDVDFWVKEVVGTSVRRVLADIAALGELRG
ncbi:hypothetical protein VE01_08750 [Pseudogymnoascus verrucosus]|uniref:Complex 1 LYR protein domain-containing protein n=1 Tax=Pseudogymnoascus verrucosus TaxID=342668 RepID=A0A1B8GC11_9PEZI|nr:uncharacterized protein VE01_08750 [Pseudogymnoascus verrucosus]OBT93371.1 hypothetical protein VE01_08750 [Pseudogymnoascus verrucosus]